MPRARDFGFEALVEVTGANISMERGALNAALKSIKEQLDGVEGEMLADVIRDMAERYRKLWPEMTLTATALAKHWNRILLEEQERAKPTTYVHHMGDVVLCTTCDGLRMVLVGYQQPKLTSWQVEQNAKRPNRPPVGLPHPDYRRPEDGHEIYMPCPDCNESALAIVRAYKDRFARQYS